MYIHTYTHVRTEKGRDHARQEMYERMRTEREELLRCVSALEAQIEVSRVQKQAAEAGSEAHKEAEERFVCVCVCVFLQCVCVCVYIYLMCVGP